MPREPSTAIAETMIARLKASGLTPSMIARESGISRMTVWRIANGDARQPSYDTVHRIERVYEARCLTRR
ncbi:transcriptional regulator with XRE-family HTH domain [Ensifer sp. WSM1721]|uniref:helix-turn-helix domain-containing protein n=1 Tax=Ensifer sp. WSM1721 TaxID=1041159 RepID=UPI00047E81B8|nr:helix-turn-helix transcriptional regulator [Ensifer sp. WSM1721]